MRQTPRQLVLAFGQKLWDRINDVPGLNPQARRREQRHRDPMLEEVARMLLRQLGLSDLASQVSVHWNSRLRTTAGLACYRTRSVCLNPKLVEISPSEVQRTLRHELAHLVAQARAGRRRITPHGVEWLDACADLGIPNETRCHDLPFKSRKIARRFFYQCRACGVVMGRVRPIKRQVACLRCCRKHNGGKYHERFRFTQVPPPDRMAA